MAIIAGNIIIGSAEPKQQPKPNNEKTVVKSFNEIRPTYTKVEKPKRFVRKNKQVIIEKRAKLSEHKPDRKSAYVRDMTTV